MTYKDQLDKHIARDDRDNICQMGDLILSGNKQCYSSDAVRRKVHEMKNELTSLRAEHDALKAKVERVEGLRSLIVDVLNAWDDLPNDEKMAPELERLSNALYAVHVYFDPDGDDKF
jgi:hypothetical protein